MARFLNRCFNTGRPGAPVYVRLLLDIYRQTQVRPDPLSRELILSLIYQQLAEPQALALTDDAQSDEAPCPIRSIHSRRKRVRSCGISIAVAG